MVNPIQSLDSLRLADRGKFDALQIGNMNAIGSDTSGTGADGIDDVAIVQIIVRIDLDFLFLQLIAANGLQSRDAAKDS